MRPALLVAAAALVTVACSTSVAKRVKGVEAVRTPWLGSQGQSYYVYTAEDGSTCSFYNSGLARPGELFDCPWRAVEATR